ncbi:hypothetical protein DL93DRAFT_2055714, partial [Clavulina sp. PMI_390]
YKGTQPDLQLDRIGVYYNNTGGVTCRVQYSLISLKPGTIASLALIRATGWSFRRDTFVFEPSGAGNN